MARPRVSKEKQKVIAREQIDRLFQLAAAGFSKDKARANRYVALARKIAMKVKLRLPQHYKRRYCKHCYAYLQPGVNARVRTRGGKVIISCLECKKFMRIPLRSKP
ncbi:ribonuclease P [Candidatus Woesearchaeota archaeon]|nr:ribonuclease P [Candidatus Woesearchaeota archaeon]